MNFDLPPTDTEQPPACVDESTCRAWLATVPLNNIAQAQAMLLRQLTLLTRFALPVADRFAVLECLRAPLRQVQEAAAKKFVARPLPLAPPEQAALDSTLAIWQAAVTNYLHCLDGVRWSARSTAIIIQRALATLADWQVDLVRSERLPEAGYWRKVNQLFAAAEVAACAEETVQDPLRHGALPVSPLAAYAECQLLHAASPYELTPRDLLWVARWARRWGSKIGLLSVPPADIRQAAHPLWADLDTDRPAGYVSQPTPQGRWLETTALRASLTTRLELLAQGQAPGELQLGSDVVQPAASQLLTRLLQRWCQGGVRRRHERQRASGACRLIVGFGAVYFHLSGGRGVRREAKGDVVLRAEREKLETFGDVAQRSITRSGIRSLMAEAPVVEHWEVIDDWQLLDASANGLRMTRPITEGMRIGAGMLLAVQREEATEFTLGCARWALRQDADRLTIGIQLFPGAARTIAVRLLEHQESAAGRPGFLIAAAAVDAAAVDEPASMVLPTGSYRPGARVAIIRPQGAEPATLTRLLDHGSEFERCLYRPD